MPHRLQDWGRLMPAVLRLHHRHACLNNTRKIAGQRSDTMTIVATRTAMKVALLALCVAGMVCSTAWAQVAPAKAGSSKSYEVDVAGTKVWVDTNIDVHGEAKLRFTATGKITYPPDDSYSGRSRTLGTFGPDGLGRGWADLIHQYAVADAGHGALIGRIGSESYAQAFLVGASKEYDVPVAGRLMLGINQSTSDAATAEGSFHVTIEVLDEGSKDAANPGGPVEARVPGITPDLLSKIPRRVSDPAGNPGDMVNALIVGTQEQMLSVFTTAGWVQVDKTVGNTALNAVMDSLEKKDYLTMPMSSLFLFNRPQDYGFAHAEPVKVAMSRNHLRVWKSPYALEGRPVWCVAATHDIGFERDQRNNGVTHKIDPAIDGEREYVNGTLSGTGLVVQRDHVSPADPLTTAKTATGGEFHSDGRVLVLVLKDTRNGSAQPGDVPKRADSAAPPITADASGLSDSKITAGLKEALQVSTGNAIASTGKPDGFLNNEAIKILVPEKLATIAKGMRMMGMGAPIDELEVGMNRAAEQATPKAKAIFLSALEKMSFADARKILFGSDTAATDYFKRTSSAELTTAFSPIVHQSMENVGVVKAYDNLVESTPAISSLAGGFNLDQYVVGKTLDGLFYMLGQEEQEIRKNPAARTTSLLKDVFGRK